jgi:hypothetical protein
LEFGAKWVAFVETPGRFNDLFSVVLLKAGEWTALLAEYPEMCQHYFLISEGA